MAELKHSFWHFLSLVNKYTGISRLVPGEENVIVMYHSVGEPGKFGNISVDRFRGDLEFFADDFSIVDLPEVEEQVDNERRLAITFDDGYGNFYRNAYPILQEFEVPATLFLTSKFVGGDFDKAIGKQHSLVSVDEDTMMDKDQISEIIDDGLVSIGNHTRTHPRLSTIQDEDRLLDEIVGAKMDLEDMFDIDIDRFSYPHGDINPEADTLVRNSHSFGVTSKNALVSTASDRYRLPRVRGHAPQYQLEWETTGLSQHFRKLAGVI